MPDRTIFTTPWLDVRERDAYTFVHTHNEVVYLLPFKCDAAGCPLVLARCEVCPAHGPTYELTSITGQCSPERDPTEVALEELYEEGGYRADQSQLIHLKSMRPVKFADTTAHLYAINVTGMEQGTPPGDGSIFEQGASVKWIPISEIDAIVCPIFLAMVALLAQQDHRMMFV